MNETATGTAQAADMNCSFCAKSHHQVRKLVAGPGVYICDECVTLCVEFIESDEPNPLRAPYLRGAGDVQSMTGIPTDELLKRLAGGTAAARGAGDNVKETVAFLRGRGVSWARIGEAVGVSRQAAWERFAGEE